MPSFFAAPLVAGTAALMLSAQPTLTVAEVRAVLRASARPFPTSGAGNGDGAPVAQCVAPAVLAGMLSGALLVYFIAEPRHSFAVDNPSNAVTIVVLLGVAMAIAVLVDAAASRAEPLGGGIVKAPYRTYYGDWQAVLRDPENNVFRVSTKEK